MSNAETDAAAAWDPAMELLYAYHDGELHGWRRWRFERRLRRDAQLRASLAELSEIANLLQQDDPAQGVDTPAVWPSVAGSLAAIDAQVESERVRNESAAGAKTAASERPASAWLPAWTSPWRLGAAAGVAALVAIAVVTSIAPPQSPPGAGGVPETLAAGTVRYIDTSGRSVMVMDDQSDALTVLWMMDEV